MMNICPIVSGYIVSSPSESSLDDIRLDHQLSQCVEKNELTVVLTDTGCGGNVILDWLLALHWRRFRADMIDREMESG
jgi:hypothetical protein